MTTKNDSRKQSLYFPMQFLLRLRFEAERTDRSMSWLVQYGLEQGGFDAITKLQTVKSVSK